MPEVMDLVEKTGKAYFNLEFFVPEHELLKYGVTNRKTFYFAEDPRLKCEFFDRFGFKESDDIEIEFQKTLINYTNALEEALRKFIEG